MPVVLEEGVEVLAAVFERRGGRGLGAEGW